MAKKYNYIINFFITDGEDEIKKMGQWGIIDLDKKGYTKIYGWSKRLKNLIKLKEKIKNPAFFMAVPLGTGIYIPVTLFYENKNITILATPDSGATLSVFGSEVAEYLGINLKKCEKVKSYFTEKYNRVVAYREKIKMRIADDKHIIDTEVDFLANKIFANLLGRYGFFNHYEVIFNPDYVIKYRFVK